MGKDQSKMAGQKGARKGTPAAQPQSVFAALKSTQPPKGAPQAQACVAAPVESAYSKRTNGYTPAPGNPVRCESSEPVFPAPDLARTESVHSSAITSKPEETREERRKRIMEAQKAAMWSDDEEETSERDSGDSAESSGDASAETSEGSVDASDGSADASDASSESRESAVFAKCSASQKLVGESDVGEPEADEVSEKPRTSEVSAAKSSASRESVGDTSDGSQNSASPEADEVSEKPETSEATAAKSSASQKSAGDMVLSGNSTKAEVDEVSEKPETSKAAAAADVEVAVSEQPEASDKESEASDEEAEDSDEESEDSDEESEDSDSDSDDSDDKDATSGGAKQAACLYSGVQDVKWAHVSHPKSHLFTYGMSGPAVGTYSPKPIVKKTKTHNFGKSKTTRTKHKCYGLNRHTPGPGSYGTPFSSFKSAGRSAGWGKSTTSRFGTPKCYGMSVRKPLRNRRMVKPTHSYMAPTKLTMIRHNSLHGNNAPVTQRRRAAAKPELANKRSARKPAKRLPKKIKAKRAPAVVKTKKTRKLKTLKKRKPTVNVVTRKQSALERVEEESHETLEEEEDSESEDAESDEESEEAEAEEESDAEESEEESKKADEASDEESEEESEEEAEESDEESEESSDDSGSGSDCDDMSDMDSILALIASHGL